MPAEVLVEDFDAVYEHYYQDVYRAVRAVVLDPGVAEDLTQEAFIKAYRSRSRYKSTGSLGGWLHKIAINLALSHMRWRSLQTRVLNAVGIESRSPQPNSGLADLVSDLLETLSPEMRASIVLHHFHGYRYREIAEILGVPEGTVATRISIGLRRMRRVLETRPEEFGSLRSLTVVETWRRES